MKGMRGLALIVALAVLVGFGSTMRWSDEGGGVAHASPDCVSGAGGLAAYYFDGSFGTLNPSGGEPWIMTLTDIDGSAVTGNKTYMLMIQDHGTGSGWESLPTQVHDDFYGAGGHLLQSDDKDWTVRSSHGFNPGDVPGTFDLRVVMQQRDDGKWDISPYFRLPGGDWTLFYDGSWTTATAFNLTKTRLAVVIDAGAGGTLCFTAPTADGTDLSNVYVDDDWAGTDPTAEVEPGKFFGVNAFATIQEGIDAVSPDGTADVADGIYNETLKLDTTKAQNISVIGSGASSTFLTGGIRFEGNYSGLDVEGFTITGDGRQRPTLSQATVGDSSSIVMVSNARFANNVFDGENVADRFGLYLDRLSGSFTFEGNEVKNYEGWGTADLNQTYNPITSYVFSENNIHDNKGSTALRGSPSDRTDTVVADGNTFDNNGGGDSWAALEINEAVSVSVTDNVITDTVAGSWGEGEALQFWHIDSLTVTGNTLDNNYQGIYFPGTDYASDLSGVEIHDNNITDSTQFGFWAEAENTGTADATDNWWGSDNGPTHASNTFNVGAQGEVVSDHVNFTPWLDAPAPGGASFAPVTTTDPVGEWPSIQAGIDASNPGGDVLAKAATFTEQPDIGKPLTLTGSGQGSTIIRSPSVLATKFVLSGKNYKPVMYIHDATDVTVQQLTVDGDGKANGNAVMKGIAFYNAGGTVDHVTITGVRETPLSGAQNADGLYAYNTDGVPRTLSVSNNTINDYQKNAMGLSGAGLTVTVTDNTVTCSGPTTVIAQNGIQVGSGASGTIQGNDVSGCKYTGPLSGNDFYNGWQGTGILTYDASGAVNVSGNTVTDNDMGIYSRLSSGAAAIQDNIVQGNLYFGIVFRRGDVTATGNTISGSEVGILVPSTRPASSSAPTAHLNNIAGNTAYGVRNDAAYQTDASDNWWGSANGPTHASNTFNVGAQGQVVSNNVDFTPWLDAPAPSGASFAPVTTTNPVGSWPSIQAGINASNAGGTVNAKAGTYSENVTIDKSVIVAGAGGATIVIPAVSKPNPCAGSSLCGSANAASNIFLVQASNVTIHHLTADGDNPTLTSGLVRGGADLDARNGIVENYYAGVYDNLHVHDVTVKNIYLRGIYASSYGTGFNFHHNSVQNVQGESQSIGIFNFGGSGVISDNSVSDCNDAIAANHSKGTQFIGNSVTNSGSGAHSDNNGSMGGVGDLIQGNIVTNSTAGGYGIWTFVPYLPITVQNNTISGVDVGLAASGQAVATPGSTSFVNNQVTGKSGSTGVYVTTDEFGWGSGNVSATFTGNTITGHDDGFLIEAQVGYTATVNATGNSIFGNSVSGATTIGASTLNATGNWWGNVSGPYNATNNADGTGNAVSDNVAYSPWLGIGTDSSGDTGFQPVSPMTFIVEPQVCLPNACIQQGVDLATAGDTILVHEGTYTENTSIDKTLSLLAASRPVLDGGAAGNVISVTADGVVIDGFEIRNGYTGIELQDVSDAVISDNEIHHNQNIPGYAGAGIVFWGDSDDNAITGNSIHDNDRQGLFIGHDSGTVISERNLISENWIYDNGLNEVGLPDASRYGIQLWNAANNRIEKNEVYGHTKTPGWWFAVGVYMCGAANTTVYANDLHDNEYNIGIYDCGGSSAGNSIVANDITDAGNTGIRVWSNAATTVARLNRITGNSSYGVNNTDTSGSVDAKSNWWGNLTGPYHVTKNPAGLGDRVSDYVLFDPWIKGIEYVGDRSIPLGSVANLRARFLNSDNTSPAVAGVQVYFDLLDSHSTPVSGSPFSAVTQSNGVASVGVPSLGVDVYTVVSRWDPLQDSDLLGVFGPGDSDGDGILDVLDNCPVVPNPDQLNTDGGPLDNGPDVPGNDLTNPSGDGYGDACDDDDDNDWLTDAFESVGCGSGPINPLLQDTDGDRVIDGAECLLGSDPKNPASKPPLVPPGDADGDGLPASIEAMFASSDADKDSEDDGFSDGEEVKGWATLPAKLDADSDGCYDWIEIASINDDTQANILDVMLVTRAALGLMPSHKAFDMDRNGSVNLLDAMRAALNSNLVRTHNPCS